MKKVTMILMVLVMMVMMSAAMASEDIIRPTENEYLYMSDVMGYIEYWAEQNGYSKYLQEYKDENGTWYGYGVVDADSFERLYECEFNEENMKKVAHEVFDGTVEIKTVGDYEGFSVKIMTAESDTQPVGYQYIDGKEIPYYAGQMLFMAYGNEK